MMNNEFADVFDNVIMSPLITRVYIAESISVFHTFIIKKKMGKM